MRLFFSLILFFVLFSFKPVFSLESAFQASSFSNSNQEYVTVDFNNVDIRLVIKYLSELTKTNFVIDKDVAGKVTVISPAKMSLDEARKVLEALLAANGYTIIEEEGVRRVVPSKTARQEKMLTWIGKEPPYGKSETQVLTQIVPLDYANADKVKTILIPYLTKAGHAASYVPTNTLIITDTIASLTKVLAIVRGLDNQIPPGLNNLRVIPLRNANAKEVALVLNSLFDEQKSQKQSNSHGAETGYTPSIVAYEGTNSLVVTSSGQDYAVIEKTVKQLDVVKDQVYVEVLIVEMTLDRASEYGLELAQTGGFTYGSEDGYNAIKPPAGPFQGILTGGNLPGKVMAAVHGSTSVGGFQLPNVGVLLKAFEDDKDVNILSTPQIIAVDNEPARILVGNRVAFIKNSQVTAEGGTVTTFEFREIGLELMILPHISENGLVRLEVEQRTEDIIGQSFEGAPETAKRETKTTVLARDNTTVVLGGLIRDDKVITQKKVPILGDIPILKAIFRSETTTIKKMNLLVFLTPHILRTSEMASSFSRTKREELDLRYLESQDEVRQVEKETLPRSAFSIIR